MYIIKQKIILVAFSRLYKYVYECLRILGENNRHRIYDMRANVLINIALSCHYNYQNYYYYTYYCVISVIIYEMYGLLFGPELNDTITGLARNDIQPISGLSR